MVLTAYCPDLKNRNKLVGVDYLTKHSMEGSEWESKVDIPRKKF